MPDSELLHPAAVAPAFSCPDLLRRPSCLKGLSGYKACEQAIGRLAASKARAVRLAVHLRRLLWCGREQAARASVEDMAHGTKRETGQQLREVQVEHGAALRQLASVQEAAARVQQKLKVCCSALHPVQKHISGADGLLQVVFSPPCELRRADVHAV